MYYDLPTIAEVRNELKKLNYKALNALALQSGVSFGSLYTTRKGVRNPSYEIVCKFLPLIPDYLENPGNRAQGVAV